jgi:dihydrofolate reductase
MLVADKAPILALIVAIGENGVIGREDVLPWRLSSDLKFFRRTTMGKPLIMGRRTFTSLKKPLDGRDNIVISRDPAFKSPGVLAAPDFETALRVGRDCAARRGTDEIIVIGGAEIYRLALPMVRRIYLTRVHAMPQGDVLFPLTDFTGWQEMLREPGVKTEKDDYTFTFIVLDRA